MRKKWIKILTFLPLILAIIAVGFMDKKSLSTTTLQVMWIGGGVAMKSLFYHLQLF